MKDTIIKGTGNSRTLKTVPNALTLYDSFPKMMQALIDGTFPIDIGPLNPAGVDTMGTILDTASVLKDATAALYGLGAEATPNDVLAVIAPLISSLDKEKVRFEAGKYTGTGSYPKVFHFSLVPKIVFVFNLDRLSGVNYETQYTFSTVIPSPPAAFTVQFRRGTNPDISTARTSEVIQLEGKTLTLTTLGDKQGIEYAYAAIG